MTTHDTEQPSNLDNLKSLWQNQKADKVYDSHQIFQMIHKKSINSIQWLFIITLIELAIGVAISLWIILSGAHFISNEEMQVLGEKGYAQMENLSHLGLLASLVLVGISYHYYKKISAALAVQELIQNIVRFRRAVVYFIILWLVFVCAIFTPMFIEIGANAYMNQTQDNHLSMEEKLILAKKVGYITSAFSICVMVFFSAVYYGLIYGVFLRRLGKNLKELKKIDQ